MKTLNFQFEESNCKKILKDSDKISVQLQPFTNKVLIS